MARGDFRRSIGVPVSERAMQLEEERIKKASGGFFNKISLAAETVRLRRIDRIVTSIQAKTGYFASGRVHVELAQEGTQFILWREASIDASEKITINVDRGENGELLAIDAASEMHDDSGVPWGSGQYNFSVYEGADPENTLSTAQVVGMLTEIKRSQKAAPGDAQFSTLA